MGGLIRPDEEKRNQFRCHCRAIGLLVLLSGPNSRSHRRRSSRTVQRFIRGLTRRVSPAVVEITVTGYGTPDSGILDGPAGSSQQLSRQRSSGSGVLVDPDGYIMTNLHVIERASALKVIVGAATDGSRAGVLKSPPPRRFDVWVLGVDADTDLALLKIDATDLPVLHFGDSDAVTQGDFVLAIGSPMFCATRCPLES